MLHDRPGYGFNPLNHLFLSSVQFALQPQAIDIALNPFLRLSLQLDRKGFRPCSFVAPPVGNPTRPNQASHKANGRESPEIKHRGYPMRAAACSAASDGTKTNPHQAQP